MDRIREKRFLCDLAVVFCFAIVVLLCLPKTAISIQDVETSKIDSQTIRVSWSDEYNRMVRKYVVKRRNINEKTDDWEVVGTVRSDRHSDGEMLFVEDVLESSKPQQFVYRVDVKLSNWSNHMAETGKEVLGSNVLICIDPGHYAGKNKVEELSYGYAEGDFMLDLAYALKQELKEKYGIDVYMTRTTEHINIHGYRDGNLDGGYISLRGRRAADRDSDLFVSLHTNANSNNAHGYKTCLQPLSMNKALILVNTIGCEDERTIAISNSIGTNLTKANYALGTSTVKEFVTVEPGKVEEWTGPKNDAIDLPGAVYYRHSREVTETPTDYYGVLRGAALVGRPGIIIEHGFHTVAEMRKEAMEGDLKSVWAEIDAYGIAYGFGFESKMKITE